MGYFDALKNFRSIDLKEIRPKGFLANIHQLWEKKSSKVAQKHGWRSVDACPVCGSSKRHVEFSKYNIDIVGCLDCSLRYASKIPRETEDIYSDEEYLPVAQQCYMQNVDYRKKRFGGERIEIIRQFTGEVKGKRLLDIGCGTGWFLDVAQEAGFGVCGQELGKELAKWTAKRLGVDVHSCPVSDIPLKQKFDVITMFDLIEHVTDPVQLVRDCKQLLTPSGIMLVFTPNFDSLAINVMKENSNLITPAEHLTYFTRKSVEKIAEQTDMELVWFKTCGIDLGDLKGFYEWKGDQALSDACERLYDLIQPVVDAAQSGNHLRFILRNNG